MSRIPGTLGAEPSIRESIQRRRSGWLWESVAERVIQLTALLSLALLLAILVLLVSKGITLFTDKDYSFWRFLWFGNAVTDNTTDPSKFDFGIRGPLVATLWVTAVAIVIAVPLALATAIFISEVAPPRVRIVIKSMAELLAGVPTIIFGFVGLALVVPWLQDNLYDRAFFTTIFGDGAAGGLSGFTAGLVVSFVTIPLIVSIADDALQAVPRDFKENAYALGANKLQTIWFVMLPAAISGITAAIMLGIARAIGETMIVLILGGGNSSVPMLPNESMRTMTATIATGFGNATDQSLVKPALYMTGAVLFVITLFTTLIADFVLERQRKKFAR
jgi:phosphate transport system permease protein